MLVLSRCPLKAGATEEDRRYSTIRIGDDVTVTVLEVRGEKVRIGVSAPRETEVHREEVWLTIQASKERFKETVK